MSPEGSMLERELKELNLYFKHIKELITVIAMHMVSEEHENSINRKIIRSARNNE